MKDDGEAAIARERAEHERNDAERQHAAWTPVLREHIKEAKDAKAESFREKLRYWRERGAPPYHGPRAVDQ
jgi:hypothetical protein